MDEPKESPRGRGILIAGIGSALIAFVCFLGWMWWHSAYSPRAVLVKSVVSLVTSSTPPAVLTTPTSTKKLVALTFDDGPYGTSTAQILDILKKEGVHATFFIIGNNVKKFPEEVQRELREGHAIGNHSLDHSQLLPKMTAIDFQKNLDAAEEIIASTTGMRPTLFRPPYGAMSDTMRTVLIQEGYRSVLWNVDPNDWDYEHSPSNVIVQRVLAGVKPNAIVLMHDGRDTHINYPRDNTVSALPIIIEKLKAEGYTFVTVSELLTMDGR